MKFTEMAKGRLSATLEEIAKENNYKDYQIEIVPITSGGANYTAKLYHATISAPYSETLNVFAKVSNVRADKRIISEKNIFDTELYFYTELSKVFEALQEKHHVPEEHRLKVPKFYKGNTKPLEEVLVLENLTVKGFSSYNRMKSITWEYAAAAVSQLAKFHALSFAYKQENPEEYEEIVKKFPFPQSGGKGETNIFFRKMLDTAIDALKEEYKLRLTAFFNDQNLFKRYTELFKKCNRNVLIHLDYRQSNLLHRRKNGKLEVIPVDFQTVSAGNPVGDLLYFIFSSSDGQFRKYHYTNLIEYYFAELTAALRRLNVNIDDVYSRSDFQNDLKNLELHGLMVSIMILPIVCVETEHSPDIAEDSNLSEMKIVPSNEFKRRINDAVEDFIKCGLL